MAASGIICRGIFLGSDVALTRAPKVPPMCTLVLLIRSFPGPPQSTGARHRRARTLFGVKPAGGGCCVSMLGAVCLIEGVWVRTKLVRGVPTPPPIRDGVALSPTKCPRFVALSSGTSRGPRKSLYLSECEFVPVPDWLMGMLLRGSSGKIHSFGACLNTHLLIRSVLGLALHLSKTE